MEILDILNNLQLQSNIKLDEIPEIDLYMDQVIQLFESKLNEATDLDTVQSIASQALANLNKIKTSNCKSSSATIVSIIALTLFIPLVVISKKRH